MAKIIYHCYGGSHSSVTAAGIHLGLLPKGRTATGSELLKVPHFDQYNAVTHGRFRFVGRDRYGNEVYVLGKRTAGPDVNVLLERIAQLFDCREEICPVDTTFPINPLMVSGGFLSRGLHLVSLGRPIVIFGTQIAYPFLKDIACNVVKGFHGDHMPKSCHSINNERLLALYVCAENDLLTMLLAGRHLYPESGDQELLNWAADLSFSGKIGSLLYLGKADGYEHYLIGAGKQPDIIAKILKEVRGLLEIPQVSLCIVQSQISPSLLLLIMRKLLKCINRGQGLSQLERILLNRYMGKITESASNIKLSILEGILD
ncbi:MAG TPA: hypothetical protein DDY25_01290 [Peptococcaceae bacterium]|nr:hypothetical protein [Peptococcaceae bacterium]